jgi:hypothetical protein
VFPLPVGERVRVRGFVTRSSDDRFKNTVDVVKDVVVPETENKKTESFQLRSSPGIFGASFTVLPAVDFDN